MSLQFLPCSLIAMYLVTKAANNYYLPMLKDRFNLRQADIDLMTTSHERLKFLLYVVIFLFVVGLVVTVA